MRGGYQIPKPTAPTPTAPTEEVSLAPEEVTPASEEVTFPSAIKEITVSGTEYSFSPPSIIVSAGEKVKIIFRNEGRVIHDLVIKELNVGTRMIGSGQTDTVEFTAPTSGTYTFICSVPGHTAAGMRGDLIVK